MTQFNYVWSLSKWFHVSEFHRQIAELLVSARHCTICIHFRLDHTQTTFDTFRHLMQNNTANMYVTNWVDSLFHSKTTLKLSPQPCACSKQTAEAHTFIVLLCFIIFFTSPSFPYIILLMIYEQLYCNIIFINSSYAKKFKQDFP